NGSGEGRPGLTGIDAAAPVMFDVFRMLKSKSWFLKPFTNLKQHAVCRFSGFSAAEPCAVVDTFFVPLAGVNSRICPYHKYVFTTKDLKYQITSDCEDIFRMEKVAWFNLPPLMEYYFKMKNSSYKTLPPYRSGCQPNSVRKTFALIYPVNKSKVFI